jgi:hypothetical protein
MEYRDLSTVAKRLTAPIRHRGRRDRQEKDSEWVVTMALSAEKMQTGQVLGKAVGQQVLKG